MSGGVIHEQSQIRWVTTPKGLATIWYLIDYGPEADIMFVCCINEGANAGQIWTYSNWDIRGADNQTMGRIDLNSVGTKPKPV